jgi:hypothetical protein
MDRPIGLTGTEPKSFPSSAIVSLNKGDYVDIQLNLGSSASANTSNDPDWMWMTISEVSNTETGAIASPINTWTTRISGSQAQGNCATGYSQYPTGTNAPSYIDVSKLVPNIAYYDDSEVTYNKYNPKIERDTKYVKDATNNYYCIKWESGDLATYDWADITAKYVSAIALPDIELGRKQFNITVTGTYWTTTRAIGIPYQLSDGTWRLKFNIAGYNTGLTSDNFVLLISGILSTVAHQAVAVFDSNILSKAADQYCTSRVSLSSNELAITCSSSFNLNYNWSLYGDIELASRPTWAY